MSEKNIWDILNRNYFLIKNAVEKFEAKTADKLDVYDSECSGQFSNSPSSLCICSRAASDNNLIFIKHYRFAQNAAGKSKAASETVTGSSVIGSSCAR